MSFTLITDSSSDIPTRQLRELDIRVLPCPYTVDGKTYVFDGDIEHFDYKEFYDGMRAGKHVTTSLLNAHTFAQQFQPYLDAGEDLVYVGFSSGISGTYHNAALAAEGLREAYPERIIRTVDSRGACLGVGILAMLGADLRAQGLDANAVADELDRAADHLCQYFTVGDLKYLRHTGRISAASAAIGTMLNIKPLLWGNERGEIVACGRFRGRQRAIDAIVAKYAQKVQDAANSRVAISHGDCLEEAQALAARIEAIAKPRELIICPHEPFTGSHVGPGMLALFFFGTTR